MVLPSVQGDLEVNHQDPEWAHQPSWSHSGGKVPNSQCSKQVEQHILHARTSLWVQRSTVLNFPPSLNAYQFPLVLGFQWVDRQQFCIWQTLSIYGSEWELVDRLKKLLEVRIKSYLVLLVCLRSWIGILQNINLHFQQEVPHTELIPLLLP